LHLAERVGQHLAVLVGDQLCQLLRVSVHQLAEREQDLRASADRGLGPGGERLLSRSHRRNRILGVGQQHLCLLLTRSGVEDR
jgi:hypothetical protein